MQYAQYAQGLPLLGHLSSEPAIIRFLAAQKTLLVPTLTWKFFQQLKQSVCFKQMQIFITIWTSLLNGLFTSVIVMCENVISATLKNCKVK